MLKNRLQAHGRLLHRKPTSKTTDLGGASLPYFDPNIMPKCHMVLTFV